MCSYCGCESIEVIGRFMAEHVEIINACGQLRRACERADLAEVAEAAKLLASRLDPHTGAEEVGLFTVMGREPEFTEHVSRLCAEHTVLDSQLAAVAAGRLEEFAAFEYGLREHIHREENGLFPAAGVALSGADWDEVDELTPPPGAAAESATGSGGHPDPGP